MKKKILILGAALTLGLALIAEFAFVDGSTGQPCLVLGGRRAGA